MRYGDVNLFYRPESLVIMSFKNQLIRQYIGTNQSDKTPLGQGPTRIMVTLVAKSEQERDLINQLLYGDQESNLRIGNRYYKRVVRGSDAQERLTQYSTWEFAAEFVALDPIPYSVATDEPLY
jgi:hypothetical protein